MGNIVEKRKKESTDQGRGSERPEDEKVK